MPGESSSSGPSGQQSGRPKVKRVPIDGAFVRFLYDYVANEAECPPLFKAFLQDVVLKPGPGDLTLRVQAYFRNPQIKDYNLGPAFLDELNKYTAYTQISDGTGSEGRFAQIPEQYQPRTSGTLSQCLLRELAEIESGGISSGHDDEELPIEPDRSAHASPPEHDTDEQQQRLTAVIGRLTELEGRFPSPMDIDPVGGVTDRTGPDWVTDSRYKGRRQPPLAVRLDTIINFLADEDVDRCIDWAAKFGEIVDYLEWLASVDESGQLDTASPQTHAMFSDAVAKAKAHALFERHHSAATPMEVVGRQPNPPLRSTRLDGMRNGHGWAVQSRAPAAPDRRDLLPRPIPPRPASPVNRMPVDRPVDDDPIYPAFVQDEEQWWKNPAGEGSPGSPPAQENLAEIETETFNSFIEEGNPGWVRVNQTTGQTTLPNGTPLPRGDRESWARERGARRAGLQQLLRAFPTGIPAELNTAWRRPVLATPAAVLLKARETADIPQWAPPALSQDQLPEDLETMPHTVSYETWLAEAKPMRELARLIVDDKHEREHASTRGAASTRRRHRGWVPLPRNLVNGGPYVWCMDDAETEAARDLLKQSRTTVEVLKAAYRREPRPLLEAVLEMLDRAEQGEFLNHVVPRDVVLAGDEWVQAGVRMVPRLVDADDDQWLRFLAGECVNSTNWTGQLVPDTERDKNRLFLIFAARMKKLLNDKNPEGLFSRHDAQVEVDSLLPVINAGSSGVTKYEFIPSEACRWLDKMKEGGQVRFYLDPACYGVVERPEAEYFPEHRVLWPTAANDHMRPSYYLCDVSDWRSVIEEGHTPDISEGSRIWKFFLSLAFRLGYTISQLEQQALTPPRAPRPSRQNLHVAIGEWEHERSILEGAANSEPTAEELAGIRTAIIDEASANHTMLAPGRARLYLDAAGATAHTVLERDHNWDWAALPAQPHRAERRQFWSVDRWPLGAGRLSAAAERAVRDDAGLDPAMTYDPVEAAGPVEERYTRPKLRPYREEKVVFREGPAVYPVGDTRLQRQALEARMTEMVAIEMGLDREPSSRFGILANLNPFSRPSSRAAAREQQGSLPPVDPKKVPRSWDPVAEAERREQERIEAEQRRREQEEGASGTATNAAQGAAVDEDDTESVDILMTGMREAWVAA